MLSPDFPVSAELAARMWVAGGGEPVDGVVAVDPVALRALVAAVGSVEVAGRTVAPDEVVALLLHDQYEIFEDANVNSERYDALGALTSAAFDAFERGDWDPVVFARELTDAARGRHVLVWSRHAEEQAGWETAGVAGALGPRSLAVSLMNTGANKLDWFTRQEVAIGHRAVDGGTEVTVTATITNETPSGETRYVAGPHPELVGAVRYGDYRGILAFTVPASAAEVRMEGVPTEVRGPDGAAQVIAGRMVLARGQSLTATVTFVVPEQVRWLEVLPSARVPASRWHHGGRTWQEDGVRRANLTSEE
jgi:hypothetical protein